MATATACVMVPTSWVIVLCLERLFSGNAPRAMLAWPRRWRVGLCAAPVISLNFATITLLEGNEDPAAVFQGRVESTCVTIVLVGRG
jgi:hypothetical protein